MSKSQLPGNWAEGIHLSGDVARDVPVFLRRHGFLHTAEHCRRVATEAARLAARFDEDLKKAVKAGWLHDVSVVIPEEDRVAIAGSAGLEVFPEEKAYPLLLHQRLSAFLAVQIFGVDDPIILDAIRCHTTLRVGATRLDKIVFCADKLAWDQPGTPPWEIPMRDGLKISLDDGARVYLRHLWEGRAALGAVHPWLVEACRDILDVNGEDS
ncbi:MAG: bis(5'-nucleosyl)-tetraphosphatase (symmetrical) YqeK [Anaerolineae bacterium]